MTPTGSNDGRTGSPAQVDPRDARIASLEAKLAARDTEIAALKALVVKLTAQVEELTEKLNQNSRNSHLPPSSDPPGRRSEASKGNKKRKGKGEHKRQRGGQKGHRGAHRALVPEDCVDDFVDIFPPQCEHCCAELDEVPDAAPMRYQTVDIPKIKPHVVEYRRHEVNCRCCGKATLAAYDERVIPSTPFGPRLMSIVATLTGVYHISRRRTVDLLSDLLEMRISLGAVSSVEARVSEALAEAFDEAFAAVERSEVKYSDSTTWLTSSSLCSLLTIATTVATVFKVLANGAKKTLLPFYGGLSGILVSDRAKSFNFWAMERRQVCWSHLLRKFVSFSERDGPAGCIGRELLDYAGIMFEYWHQHKDGKLSRDRFVVLMRPIRAQVEAVLERAVANKIDRLWGSCADILEHRLALWTFVDCEAVEPTNNHAERELRAFVMWRRRSFGTQSQRGNLFAERVMTVAHTARKQGINTFEFITSCVVAKRDGVRPPKLIRCATA